MPEDPKEYQVRIPKEVHRVFQFKQNDLPGIATINTALIEFEPKLVFGWHFSMLIDCKNLAEQGMPDAEEQQILNKIEDTIDPLIKSKNNALFLARVTHDGLRELVYRIYNPEPVNEQLQQLIKSKELQRPFDYRIEPDEKWEKATWFLDSAGK